MGTIYHFLHPDEGEVKERGLQNLTSLRLVYLTRQLFCLGGSEEARVIAGNSGNSCSKLGPCLPSPFSEKGNGQTGHQVLGCPAFPDRVGGLAFVRLLKGEPEISKSVLCMDEIDVAPPKKPWKSDSKK